MHNGKFAGCVVTQIVAAEGKDVIEILLTGGHGRGHLRGKYFGRQT